MKRADAQLVLARSYGVSSWPRLVQACRMTDAICRDDVDAVLGRRFHSPSWVNREALRAVQEAGGRE